MDMTIEKMAAQIELLPKEEQKQFIAELLKKKEKQSSLETGKLMPLQEYIDLGVNELTHSKPKQLFINGAEHINFGDSWTSFMIHCVRYFIDQGDIKDDFTPVCSSKGKRILIPNLSMSDNKDHKFDKVIPFCFVDTKYNVSYQLKNLVKIMQHFGIEQNYKIKLSIYRHK